MQRDIERRMESHINPGLEMLYNPPSGGQLAMRPEISPTFGMLNNSASGLQPARPAGQHPFALHRTVERDHLASWPPATHQLHGAPPTPGSLAAHARVREPSTSRDHPWAYPRSDVPDAGSSCRAPSDAGTMPDPADSDEEDVAPMSKKFKDGLQTRVNEMKAELKKCQTTREHLVAKTNKTSHDVTALSDLTNVMGRANVSCSKLENVVREVAMTQKERVQISLEASEDCHLCDAQGVASRHTKE